MLAGDAHRGPGEQDGVLVAPRACSGCLFCIDPFGSSGRRVTLFYPAVGIVLLSSSGPLPDARGACQDLADLPGDAQRVDRELGTGSAGADPDDGLPRGPGQRHLGAEEPVGEPVGADADQDGVGVLVWLCREETGLGHAHPGDHVVVRPQASAERPGDFLARQVCSGDRDGWQRQLLPLRWRRAVPALVTAGWARWVSWGYASSLPATRPAKPRSRSHLPWRLRLLEYSSN